MTVAHQTVLPWEWSVGARSATRLAAAECDRWLLVTAGLAWLTRSGAGPHGDDVWLAGGERHLLPAGSEWVVEGSPAARLALLETPQSPLRRGFGLGRWPALRRASPGASRPVA